MDKIDHLEKLNNWIRIISHNYILIIVAAIIFFACKSLIGYLTYRKFMRELKEIKQLIEDMR
ncbi:hypothetical protein [Paenibacillus sp. LjRoot56]|uniref:hypothetical protein n=1 Tax=Paenibacillus sp. LjRoot56 TaxID=3342333 RepID=UPI0006FECAA0|nr:hypothetical protein ASL11_16630 [Paenibacillus sp. Soil750]